MKAEMTKRELQYNRNAGNYLLTIPSGGVGNIEIRRGTHLQICVNKSGDLVIRAPIEEAGT